MGGGGGNKLNNRSELHVRIPKPLLPEWGGCTSGQLGGGHIGYNDSLESNGEYPLGTMASFTCDQGRNLEGGSSRICPPPRNWNRLPATCRFGTNNTIVL